jgi:Etoposide-induced protein 2.4 (EI24)
MQLALDALWRALAYCFHPKVIWLTVSPVVISALLALVSWYFFWDGAVASVNHLLESWSFFASLKPQLEGWRVTKALAPLLVMLLSTPVIVLFSLTVVSLMMTPAIVQLVVQRRFGSLQSRVDTGAIKSLWFSMRSTLIALVALVLSMPLWLIPPLMWVLPPLIWGWLTCRVMGNDVLAEHASKAERETLLRQHRWPLLAMGVATGYMGAAPSLIWVAGALTLVLAPVLMLVAIWLYTLVFAFSLLWFAHFALAALEDLRKSEASNKIGAARPSLIS